MRAPEEITKPVGYRLEELIQSLLVIRDSLELVRKGERHQLIPLYGQLRALLCEKSRNNKPLLRDIADSLGASLNVYCMPGVDDPLFPEELRKGLVLHLAGFPVSLQQLLPSQVAATLEDFIEREILLYKERRYTVRNVIDWFANQAGGAHFAPRAPRDFIELMSVVVLGQSPLTSALLQLAEMTFVLGRQLLRRLADLDLHALVIVPRKKVEKRMFLVDSAMPNTTMRWYLTMEPGMRLCFGVQGLEGIRAEVQAERLIEWSRCVHVHAALSIDDRLSSRLELFADGTRLGETSVPRPIFVASDPLEYNTFHNRSQENTGDGADFGLAELLLLGRSVERTLTEEARLEVYLADRCADPELACVFYAPTSFGHAPPGTKNLAMTGAVSMSTVGKVGRGEFPQQAVATT